jgi:hypothetical protein
LFSDEICRTKFSVPHIQTFVWATPLKLQISKLYVHQVGPNDSELVSRQIQGFAHMETSKFEEHGKSFTGFQNDGDFQKY